MELRILLLFDVGRVLWLDENRGELLQDIEEEGVRVRDPFRYRNGENF